MIGNNFYNIGYNSSHFKQNANRQSEIFEPEYIAILNRATALGYTKPTADQQILQNLHLKNLKIIDVWDKLDYYFVAANNGGAQFACINWKNPSADVALLVSSPAFTTNVGFNSTGAGSYIDTQFNAFTQGVNFTNNNASEFAYHTVDLFAFNCIFGTAASSGDGLNIGSSTVGQRLNMPSNNMNIAADMSGSGFKLIIRNSPTSVVLYNNTTIINRTATVATRINANRRILFGQNNTAPTTVKVSIYGNGASLIFQALDLRTEIIRYLTTL
jgi:hypothetical protein